MEKIVKKQKSVDAFPVFRLQARSYTSNQLHLTTPHEKEIHFAIRVFNLRVLIGLFVALTGVSLLALGQFATAANPFRLGVGASSHARTSQAQPQYKVTTRSQYIDPLVPPGFDCSKIHQLGIDKMENFRAGAIMIHCGLAKGRRT